MQYIDFNEKIGIVYPGGGSKGSRQVGVTQYMADAGLFLNGVDFVSGTSVGALNSLAIAMYPKSHIQMKQAAAKMQAVWAQIHRDQDVWTKYFPPYISALWRPSIGDNAPLRRLLIKEIDESAIRLSDVEWIVSAVNLETGELRYFGKDDPIISSVMASSSFPVAFPPEVIDGERWSDGGLRDIAPLRPAIQAGCTRIVIIPCANPWHIKQIKGSSLKSVVGLGIRCLDIVLNELLLNDIEQCRRINRDVLAGNACDKRYIKLDVIVPTHPLASPLSFDGDAMQRQIQYGYDEAAEYFRDSQS